MAKPKTFRPWVPEQTLLLPPSPVDWLPADHLVFFMLELPNELDFERTSAGSAGWRVWISQPRGLS